MSPVKLESLPSSLAQGSNPYLLNQSQACCHYTSKLCGRGVSGGDSHRPMKFFPFNDVQGFIYLRFRPGEVAFQGSFCHHRGVLFELFIIVRMEGFEPPTPWPQTKSHGRLRTSRVLVFPSRQKNSSQVATHPSY